MGILRDLRKEQREQRDQIDLDSNDKVLGAVLGLAVGDALGVPVEFNYREELKKHPVTDMMGYGTYNMPKGTWSDDTSMTLALMDALAEDRKEIDYGNIMDKFCLWVDEAKYTATDELFDIGNTCRNAIMQYKRYHTDPIECGPDGEYECGNGALMRIIPMLFWCVSKYGMDFIENKDARMEIYNVTSLTHAHARCKLSNVIYLSIAAELLGGKDIEDAVETGLSRVKDIYKDNTEMSEEMKVLNLIFNPDLRSVPEEEIGSSGYVVDTLIASVWCLLITNNYKDCVLKAVNLGRDTDTTGAVVGALAGIHYGLKDIPKEWLSCMKVEYLKEICDRFSGSLK